MTVLDNDGLRYYNERLLAYLKSLSWSSDQPVVEAFNGRSGIVTPETGDYTASMVGAVPTTRTVNGKALSSDITLSAADVSAVPTTRTVNSKALSGNITLTASDVSAVPTTRTVNGKALSSDISLTASDVGALSSPVAIADGGTGGTTASTAVYKLVSPLTTRTSANLTSFASSTYVPCYYSTTAYRVTLTHLLAYIKTNIGLTATDVEAVPTTRTVNGKELSADITLTAADVGAVSAPVSIANGGTGKTTATAAMYALTGGLTIRSANDFATSASSTYIPCQVSTAAYRLSVSTLLGYIKDNLDLTAEDLGISGLQTMIVKRAGTGVTSTSGSTGVHLNVPKNWKMVLSTDGQRLMMLTYIGYNFCMNVGPGSSHNCFEMRFSTGTDYISYYYAGSLTTGVPDICLNASGSNYYWFIFYGDYTES